MIFRTFQWFNLTYLFIFVFFTFFSNKQYREKVQKRLQESVGNLERKLQIEMKKGERKKNNIICIFAFIFFFSNKFYICSIDVKCKFNFSSLFWNRFKFITLLHYFIFYIWIYRNKCILLNYFYTFFKYISLFVFISIIFILFISL